MLVIEDLEIDEHILDKIESKHGVQLSEVEEICYSEHQARRGSGGVYRLFGQTEAGRYLLVVVIRRQQNIWKIVTARDMTDSERRLLQDS